MKEPFGRRIIRKAKLLPRMVVRIIGGGLVAVGLCSEAYASVYMCNNAQGVLNVQDAGGLINGIENMCRYHASYSVNGSDLLKSTNDSVRAAAAAPRINMAANLRNGAFFSEIRPQNPNGDGYHVSPNNRMPAAGDLTDIFVELLVQYVRTKSNLPACQNITRNQVVVPVRAQKVMDGKPHITLRVVPQAGAPVNVHVYRMRVEVDCGGKIFQTPYAWSTE